jgi:uncharacterized protein (DUF302 family)
MLSKLRIVLSALVLIAVAAFAGDEANARNSGIVKVKSAVSHEEAVNRIKRDVAAKGIQLFDVIDQAKLAKDAGIDINPSTLIIFGNPPLGTQFLSANPESGLDWPVRVLVYQDSKGRVWAAYTDFGWIANRHGIKSRGPQFKMASEVISSITSTIKTR